MNHLKPLRCPKGLLRCIVFDVGNVILYFNNHLVSQRLAQITGRPESQLFKYIFGLYNDMELDLGKTPTQQFLKTVKDELRLDMDLAHLGILFSDIFAENVLVSEFIRKLKWKLPLIALSNTNESHFEFIKHRFSILQLLDHCVLSYVSGLKKPHPGIYFEALKWSGTRAENCLFIDDQEKNTTPARKLGFQTHLYRSFENLSQAISRFRLD